MPYYYSKEQPKAPWTANSSSMNVSIVLDHPTNVSFTNLDQVNGRVLLRCPKEVPVDSIIVKLEGESRTRLLSPAASGEKQKPQLEYHKVLYKVALVFPSTDTARNRQNVGMGKNAQSLPVGAHEFPFTFKLPFNNSCVHEMTKSPTMSLSGSGIEVAKAPTRHVKKTLPPTLSGFPGEAEIRYYVKATVTRHYFWQESLRAIVPFNFFPIEPPRPAATGTEIYARQTYTFNQLTVVESTKSKMKSLFARSTGSSAPATIGPSAMVSVDARLPEPAILTCNEDIPLRLIVKKLSEFGGMMYLESLQLSLVGTTKIRAHDAYRSENSDWVIMSKSNLGVPIGAASDPVDMETVVNDHLWRGQLLPNTVAPSFLACNIERAYYLDVRVGLSYSDAAQSNSRPQTVVLLLKLELEVYSGIAPPKELLEAMAEAQVSIRRRSTIDSTNSKATASDRKFSTTSVPPTPMEAAGYSSSYLNVPAREGTQVPPSQAPAYGDAPPSYEDAVATRLPPLDGTRPQYAPPPPGDDDLLLGDEKTRLKGRRDS